MKMMILIGALMLGTQAQADMHEAKDGKGFEAHKAEALKGIDERLAKLNEHKTCVTAAADKEAFKKCHESMKEFRHDKKEEWKEKREEMKEKRKARKEKKEDKE